MKKKIIVLVKPLILVGLFVLILFIIKNNMVRRVNKIVISDLELADIEDGNYTGEFSLSLVKARVQVYIKDHRIYEIKILEHRNELGKSAETITDRIIEKQGLDVDVVSGATVSSKVILKATENALTK